MAERRGDFLKMGSEICLCHIASGPSAIETSREPILDRLSSDFIRLDCEPTFSKTGSGLNLCRRAKRALSESITQVLDPPEIAFGFYGV